MEKLNIFKFDWISKPDSDYGMFYRVKRGDLWGILYKDNNSNDKCISLSIKYNSINYAKIHYLPAFYNVLLNDTFILYTVVELYHLLYVNSWCRPLSSHCYLRFLGDVPYNIKSKSEWFMSNEESHFVKINQNGQYGIFDKDGNTIVDFGIFDWIEPYIGEFARARKLTKTSHVGKILGKDYTIKISDNEAENGIFRIENVIINRQGNIVSWRNYYNYRRRVYYNKYGHDNYRWYLNCFN